ncbi:protein-L-isoaspartate(D-aspartate) O-methyltransferase [Rubritalea tangerina]|uniref:Protein-L-isoaspartate O-methyltransferase n=1 Tax=Rubritalea tangerina TaxID=430798 RepID=A0ABW4Z989_9BACT
MAHSAQDMVDTDLRARGITSRPVLNAMLHTPREAFIPNELHDQAYADRALPIGHQQTISQPYIVARILELAELKPHFHILDVGTGSGYLAAVASRLVQQVSTIERIPELAQQAQRRFQSLSLTNIQIHLGNATLAWTPHTLFDAILVSCAIPEAPPTLLDQLAKSARLIIPIGHPHKTQQLCCYQKLPNGTLNCTEHLPVRFVPML